MELLSSLSNAIVLFMLWLFMSAGFSKLMPANRSYYQDLLKDYGVALPELAAILVVLLGLVEALSALLILIPATRILGLIGCGFLLILYFLVMAAQLWQGKQDMDCGCSGPAGSVKVSPLLLVRNLIFLALIGIGLFDYLVLAKLGLNINDWVLALPMALLLILIHQSAEQLLANAQKLKLLKAVM